MSWQLPRRTAAGLLTVLAATLLLASPTQAGGTFVGYVDVYPTAGPAGSTIRAHGKNLMPNMTFELRFAQDRDVNSSYCIPAYDVVGTGRTDVQGNVTVYATIPSTALNGDRWLWFTSTDEIYRSGNEATFTVTRDLTSLDWVAFQDVEEEGAAEAEDASDAVQQGSVDAPDPNAESPEITDEDLRGKTRTQIRDLAERLGLKPHGDPDDPRYPRKWRDPETTTPRLRLEDGHTTGDGKPYDNPRAAVDHAHGYEPDGTPIGDSKVVSPKYPDGDPHFPTTGE